MNAADWVIVLRGNAANYYRGTTTYREFQRLQLEAWRSIYNLGLTRPVVALLNH